VVQANPSQDTAPDLERVLQEMKELRAQLLAVVGANHPATRTIDARILQMTARGTAMAENLLNQSFVPLDSQSFDPLVSLAERGLFNRTAGLGPVTLEGFVGPEPDADLASPQSTWLWSPHTLPQVAWAVGQPPGRTALSRQTAELKEKWDAADNDEQRNQVIGELRQVIASQFDADLNRRRQQFADLEQKLQQLRQQIEKRESKRDDFVEVLARHTEMEWEGISLPTSQGGRTIFAAPTTLPTPPPVAPAGK
jgi:hypothetical protein